MGYADLIQQRLQSLSQQQQERVLAYVESLVERGAAKSDSDEAHRRTRIAAIAAARACMPQKLSPKELDIETSAMRSEWDNRGWDVSR